MGILIQALGLLLSLSILVILHELGHFSFARLFKTRVEKFYLFFDFWGVKLFKLKKGDTEYGMGWMPLGGYVKISGMIDESMDKEALKEPAKPWEFRSKPAWQRLLIMIGGVMVNFILALLIYVFLLYHNGQEYLSLKNVKYGVVCDSVLLNIGVKNGDKILALDNNDSLKFNDFSKIILLNNIKTLKVEREGKLITIPVPSNFAKTVLAKEVKVLIMPQVPVVIDSVIKGEPASFSGLKKNDQVIAVNNVSSPYFNQFAQTLQSQKGKKITITVKRGNDTLILPITVNAQGRIGVANRNPQTFFQFDKIDYTFIQSIPAGISFGIETLTDYIKQFKLVFTKEGASQIGGFGSIGSIFPKLWDWNIFWERTALLSIILAFMNILPIPALDGGHVLFLAYEMITGRKPSDKFLEYAQIIGMGLLFSLLIYANLNDVWRFFFKG